MWEYTGYKDRESTHHQGNPVHLALQTDNAQAFTLFPAHYCMYGVRSANHCCIYGLEPPPGSAHDRAGLRLCANNNHKAIAP